MCRHYWVGVGCLSLSILACSSGASSGKREFHDRQAFLDLPSCVPQEPFPGPPDSVVHLGSEMVECEVVVLNTGLRLSSDLEGTVPDPAYPIVLNSQGQFLTATSATGEVAVWSSAGEFSRLMATRGDGPGELRGRPTIVVDPWDSIHVRHAEGTRWSVFDPDFLYRRINQGRMRIVDHQRTLFVPSGEAITAFSWPGLPRTEHVFEVVSRHDGEMVRSFGLPGPEETNPRRLLSPGTDSTFWSIPEHRYRAEEWTVQGKRLRVVERNADWFRRDDDSVWDSTKDTYLPSEIKGIHFDRESGLLWTLVLVPDLKASDYDPSRGYRSDQFRSFFDLVVEVLDVGRSKVLASWRADGREESIAGFLSDGRAFRWTVDRSSGLRRFDVLELRVVRFSP